MKYFFLIIGLFALPLTDSWSQELDEAQLRNFYRNHSFVRVWNFCEPGTEPLGVEISNSGSKIQGDEMRWHDIGDYRSLTPGSFGISLRRGATVVSTQPMQLDPGTWMTVIALPDGSKFKLDVIEDTYDYSEATTAQVQVFNAFPDTTITVVSPHKDVGSKQLAPFENLEITDLDPAIEEIQISFDGPLGPEEHTVSLDFTFGKSMAIIAMKDRYERSRLRGIYRGFVDEGFLPLEQAP